MSSEAGTALSRHSDRFQQVIILRLSRVSHVLCHARIFRVWITFPHCRGGSHHDALPDRRLAFDRFGTAVVALVFLLGFLYLALFHLAFVKVEGRDGHEYYPNDHRDEHEKHDGGRERLEQLIHPVKAGAIVGPSGSV